MDADAEGLLLRASRRLGRCRRTLQHLSRQFRARKCRDNWLAGHPRRARRLSPWCAHDRGALRLLQALEEGPLADGFPRLFQDELEALAETRLAGSAARLRRAATRQSRDPPLASLSTSPHMQRRDARLLARAWSGMLSCMEHVIAASGERPAARSLRTLARRANAELTRFLRDTAGWG